MDARLTPAMDIPRSLQDFLGSGAGDSAPCTIIDGPIRTRSGGNHISVRPPRGADYRSRDAAWWPVEFASLVARVLANEARSLAA